MTCPKQWIFAPQVTALAGHTVPSTVAPVYVAHPDVMLTYPYISPSLTVTLRSPNFGDTRSVTVESVRNASMNGFVTINRNPLWPIVEIFNYAFTAIDEDIMSDYFNFLQVSLGLEVGLRDHRGQQWRGFILNPEAAISEQQVCDDNIELNFRGQLA